jgi:hypothetical protein
MDEARRSVARKLALDVLSRRTWAATGYLMATYVVGLFWFVFTVTAVSVGVALPSCGSGSRSWCSPPSAGREALAPSAPSSG